MEKQQLHTFIDAYLGNILMELEEKTRLPKVLVSICFSYYIDQLFCQNYLIREWTKKIGSLVIKNVYVASQLMGDG